MSSPIAVTVPAGSYNGAAGTAISFSGVTILDDATSEPDETIHLALQNPSSLLGLGDANSDSVTQSDFTYTIINDDGATPTVTRIPGITPERQAIEISKQRFPTPGTAQAVAIARKNNLVDSLASGPLVNLTSASLLLTDTATLDAATLTELQRVIASPTAQVYIIGGTRAVSSTVEQTLKKHGFTNLARFAGVNRRQTASLIGDEIIKKNGSPTDTVYMTEDLRFADDLAVGAVAGQHADGKVEPILLNHRSSSALDPYVRDFLNRNPAITHIVIVGGLDALPLGIEVEIAGSSAGRITTRYAGTDRYSTNALLAQAFFPNPTGVIVALGTDQGLPGSVVIGATSYSTASLAVGQLYSALIANTLAADQSVPVLLTMPDKLPTPILNYLKAHAATISSATIIGDGSAISAAVANQILGAI
ncbi:MAG: cell wall-binding repeat-containing protein [Candidatus Andersenbacteria bacterium]